MSDKSSNCWVCNQTNLSKIKESDLNDIIDSNNYAITNADYGITGELSKCQNCDFIQCTKENDVIHFYENLVDEEYENTRAERKQQETKILKYIKKIKPEGSLLDIGSGSGILVESALEMGYQAEGIEPSRWLYEQAIKRSLPIHKGIFPMKGLKEKYDIITLIDVIEHINNPFNLMEEIHKKLAADGILVIITPDVNSFMAKFLKWKWWHFRVAHIGYFCKSNLNLLAQRTGFKSIRFKRPSWYFNLDYLFTRGNAYLPKYIKFPIPDFFSKIIVPVNLGDSMLIVYKKI